MMSQAYYSLQITARTRAAIISYNVDCTLVARFFVVLLKRRVMTFLSGLSLSLIFAFHVILPGPIPTPLQCARPD